MAKKQTEEQKVVKAYVNGLLDEETQRLARLAWWDLWYGPIALEGDNGPDDGKPWCGFTEACAKVSEALSELGELWVEGDCVMTSEPQGWLDEETGEYIDPCLEFTYHFSRSEALACALDEVAEYL